MFKYGIFFNPTSDFTLGLEYRKGNEGTVNALEASIYHRADATT